jgi:filamentous hemagglutinin
VSITAKDIDIEAGYDTYNGDSITKTKQSGLTIAFTGGVVAAIESATSSVSDVGESKNSRVNAMATANAAYDVYQAAQAIQSLASDPNVGISITVGSSQSESKTHYEGESVVSSSVAGDNVTLKATGDKENSDINIVGSDVAGVTSTTLNSDHDINIIAASSTDEQHSKDKSSGWNVGVAVTVGANGMSAGFTGGANVGKGKSDGESETYTNSHVGSLSGTTTLSAGDTTNIIGGQVLGDKVTLNTTNLNIESLQDTATYDSKQMSASGQVTIGYGFSASGSYSNSNIESDYASVGEQSGILAGDGGYNINVTDDTSLIGGIITSNQIAEDNGLNSFSTGTLTYSDIQNYASASADGMGISGGYSWSNPDAPSDSGLYNPDHTTTKYDVGKDVFRNLMDNAEESESSSSTTYSAINTDNITITDNEAQQSLTGKNADETISDINHDTTNTSTTLEQIDYKALANDVEIQRDFYNNVSEVVLSQVDLMHQAGFVTPTQILFQQCDEGGQNCHPVAVDLSDVQAVNGQIFIFNNGIFNSLDYALANAAQQSSDEANAQGVYVIYNPETGSPVAEMLYALYDKTNEFLGGALPLTNAEITNQAINDIALEQEALIYSINHSRGTMTYYIATADTLSNGETYLPIGVVTFNGAAANAQNMTNLVNTATNGMGTVQYSTHETDWVGLYIGLNPATGGLDSYEFPWSHSSYVGFLPPILMSNGSQNNLRTITDQAWGDGQINQPQIVSPTN